MRGYRVGEMLGDTRTDWRRTILLELRRARRLSWRAHQSSFASMLLAKCLAAQLCLRRAPPIVNTTLPCSAIQHGLEIFLVAQFNFLRECILCRFQFLFE